MRGSPYWVIVCDLFHSHEPDHETVVVGFPTKELAVEYARRRVWSSVEEMKAPGRSPEQVRERWLAFGEDCRVVGPGGEVVYLARSELETFIARPIPPERRDWVGLYKSLLPEGFRFAYEWAAATVPPPGHYEYTIEVGPGERGHITFWPDYPGPDVPRWEQDFLPSLGGRIVLANWLRVTGWLDSPPPQPAEPPIGGETGVLDVTAGGRRAQIRLHWLPERDHQELHRAVRAVVPDYVWEKVEAWRQEYVQRIYGSEEM